jgi:hypothetical protein
MTLTPIKLLEYAKEELSKTKVLIPMEKPIIVVKYLTKDKVKGNVDPST